MLPSFYTSLNSIAIGLDLQYKGFVSFSFWERSKGQISILMEETLAQRCSFKGFSERL